MTSEFWKILVTLNDNCLLSFQQDNLFIMNDLIDLI